MSERTPTLDTELAALRQRIETLSQVKNERALIFIDNTNLNLTAKKVDCSGKYRICYNKLVQHLLAGRVMKQCRIYYSDFDSTALLSAEDQAKRHERESFYNYLKFQGFWLKSLPLVDAGDGRTKEKGLDAAITKDFERLAQRNAADTFILVSGDADYRELVSEVQSLYGIPVEVAFFAEYASRNLQYASTRFIDLGRVKDQIKR